MARHEDILRSLRVGVFGAAGRTGEEVRRAAFEGDFSKVPAAARAFLAKVRDRAHQITDEEVSALRAAGLSEEEIYDLTVVTALGASWKRLDVGWRALRSRIHQSIIMPGGKP